MEISQGKLLKIITSFLERSKIPYMITGAWSVIYYGRPRASHDIDFVVEMKKEDLKKVLKAMNSLPDGFSVQKEAIEDAILKNDMFNILHLPTMLKLDFWPLTKDLFDKSRFLRRQRVKILGQFMDIASAEDTILQKLRWYKMGKIEKHLVDAAFVYQIQGDNLDTVYLADWVGRLRLEKYFKKLEQINLEEYL